jgi:hypothetical protein
MIGEVSEISDVSDLSPSILLRRLCRQGSAIAARGRIASRADTGGPLRIHSYRKNGYIRYRTCRSW